MGRCAIALICAFLLIITWARADDQESKPTLLTVHVSGDRIVNDEATDRLQVDGNVRILAYTDDPDSPRLAISASTVDVDLAGKVVEAHGSVLMRTDQAAFRGDSVRYDMEADEMRLIRAAASVDLPRPDGEVFRGYFFGEEIQTHGGSQLIIINGMITPCESPYRPDVAASAARVVYNAETGKGTIYKGRLHLLGAGIPLLSRMSFKHGVEQSEPGFEVSLPGYSGYDGIYVPFRYDFAAPESPWRASLSARVATRTHLRGVASLVRSTEDYDFKVYVSRHQHVTDNITRRLTISQVPEIEYVRRFDTANPRNHWETGLNLGRFHERDPDPGSVKRSDDRISAWVGYIHNPRQRTSREGYWWGVNVTQNLYDEGTRFRDISVETGIGGHISDSLGASLSLITHHTSGQSPFQFDDVDIEHEAYGMLRWQMSPLWTFQSDGRYDLKNDSLRDYGLRLSRRSHYLTFSVEYDFSERSIGLRVDINGLTGNTKPAQTTPVVTDQEVQMTPEWVHQQASELMQRAEPATSSTLF